MKQREIKFRAWIPSIKKMGMAWDMHKELTTGMDSTHDVFPYEAIFMQFTGLLDRHGKEIYEGDVVRSKGNPRLLVARFDEHYGAFIFENQNNHIDCEIVGLNNRHGDNGELIEREVIGNIYENPELLTHPS